MTTIVFDIRSTLCIDCAAIMTSDKPGMIRVIHYYPTFGFSEQRLADLLDSRCMVSMDNLGPHHNVSNFRVIA